MKFVVVTDHEPLSCIFKANDAKSRFTILRLKLEGFHCTNIYRRGGQEIRE
jgi:hypothetical protein